MPPASRYCRNGHDTWEVGRTKRHCNVCARHARDKYATTPKGKAALRRASDNYQGTLKQVLNSIRSEANRRGRR